MREISFVKKLKFNFNGGVTKKALVIGDADNDKHNELVCANLQGDLAIFKGRNPNKYAYATDLGMVTACVVGDVINAGRNYVAAINTEGWLFIFHLLSGETPTTTTTTSTTPLTSDNSSVINAGGCDTIKQEASLFQSSTIENHGAKERPSSALGIKLESFYEQRMPANCKELLLADLDGDGQNEVIVGLTDRVLRTYKWIKIGPDSGKFVGLYKWEFADQIGAVSLNPSRYENCQDIIVAQPGGTYAKLECFDKKPATITTTGSGSGGDEKQQTSSFEETTEGAGDNSPGCDGGDNVRTEYISKLTPEYHQLALSQMRNHHISTEVLGGIRLGKQSNSYSLIVIATLDGTLMLVNKDEILWSLQVDHQLFALAKLETIEKCSRPPMKSESTCTIIPNLDMQVETNNTKQDHHTRQYFVVCAWNGKTYIIDEERNYLRFKLDEAVSAFTAGNYYFDDSDHTSLVYATFNNQVILYYDVILDNIRPIYLLNEVTNNPDYKDLLEKLESLTACFDSNGDEQQPMTVHELLSEILYNNDNNRLAD